MAFDHWEYDNAHNALNCWLAGWRERPGKVDGEARPAYVFAEHLGREVTAMDREGWSRVELARVCSASGLDGLCPACGRSPDDLVTERAAEIVDQRRERALTTSHYGGSVRA